MTFRSSEAGGGAGGGAGGAGGGTGGGGGGGASQSSRALGECGVGGPPLYRALQGGKHHVLVQGESSEIQGVITTGMVQDC